MNFTSEEFESSTSSINVSSRNTNVEFFSAFFTIASIDFFDKSSPVGLFGLQKNIIPFVGILVKNFECCKTHIKEYLEFLSKEDLRNILIKIFCSMDLMHKISF